MAGKGETRGGGLGGEEDRINLLAKVVSVIAVVVVVVLVMLLVRDWCNFQLCEKEVTTKGSRGKMGSSTGYSKQRVMDGSFSDGASDEPERRAEMPERARRVRAEGGILGSLGTWAVGTLGLLSGCGVGLACLV